MNVLKQLLPKSWGPILGQNEAPPAASKGEHSPKKKESNQRLDRTDISKDASETSTAPAEQVPNFTQSFGPKETLEPNSRGDY